MSKATDASSWIEFAETEISAATHLFNTHHPMPTNIVCYLSQQSIEKALKAILVENNDEFPKVHDIRKILDKTRIYEPSIDIDGKAADKITLFAIESRYPDNILDFTKEDAELGLKYAKEILDKVKTALNITQEQTQDRQAYCPQANKEQENRPDDEIEGDFLWKI